jgi:YD repeat-containing protein
MKSPILILISFLFFSCTIEKVKSDLMYEHLNGNVKSITDSIFEMGGVWAGKSHSKRLFSYTISNYDKKGNEIVESNYSGGGILFLKRSFQHDKKGNQIEENDEGSNNNATQKLKSTFNEKGNVIKMVYYDSINKPSGTSIIKYDDKDFICEEDQYKLDGSLSIKEIYKTDTIGNPIKVIEQSDSDTNITTYTYDEKGNLIEYCSFHSNDSLIFKTVYKYENYDEIGNWHIKCDFREDKLRYITKRKIEYY